MFNSTNGNFPSLADIAAVTDKDGNSVFGNGSYLVVLLIILMFFCGGFGGFGGYGGNGFMPWMFMGMNGDSNHTDASIQRGFDNAAVTGQLNAITSDISNGFANTNTAILQGFGNLNTSLCSSFDGVTSGLNDLGYNLQNDLLQVSNAIQGVNYTNAQNTSEIIQASNANTQRLMDMITQNQMQDLRDRLQNAEFQNSQATQTADIISQLQPVAKPSYIVSSPYASQMYGCNCGMA